MNEQTRKALELARNWFDDDKNKVRVSDVLAAIDAALSAPAAPVAQGDPVAWLKEWDSVGHARMGMRRVDLTPECETWLANMFPRITPLYVAPAPAPAASVAQPLVESVINAARAAMDESTEAYDADMSIKIPSHLAASLSLCLDEYDRAHGIVQGSAA